jgi:hypothetical protein
MKMRIDAEAAGVSREQFQTWLKSKYRRYRQFAAEVRTARAQARLQAEMALFADDPRSWLKAGPGRETNGEPGWSKDVPPRIDKDESPRANPLADSAWRDLLAKVLEALLPYPEARAALAGLLKPRA